MSYAYVNSGPSGMLLDSKSASCVPNAEERKSQATAMLQKFAGIVGADAKPQLPDNNAIGCLAAELGLVNKFDLIDAREMSSYNNIPFGLGLLAVGCLSRSQLSILLRAQSLLMDHVASRDQILKASNDVFLDSRISLHTALSRTRWVRQSDQTNTLGELLIQANLLTPLQFARIHNFSNQSMLPIGRVMILLEVLSSSIVNAALDVQKEIRKGRMSRHDGIMKLRSLASRTTEISHRQQARPKSKIKHPLLGELLIEAGVLSTTDVICAVSIALPRQKLLGEVLREFNWISENLLQDALALQKLVDVLIVTRFQAVKALKLVLSGKPLKLALEAVLCTINLERKQVFFRQLIAKVQMHYVSKPDLKTVENMFVHGRIEAEQAIMLLTHCAISSLPLETVLSKLGWTIEMDIRDCRVN